MHQSKPAQGICQVKLSFRSELPVDPFSFPIKRFRFRRQAQFAGDIRLMPKGKRQAWRPPDFPIQHGGALVVMPRRLQVPDVMLCLSETAKSLRQIRPVSVYRSATHRLEKDRARIRRAALPTRLITSGKLLLETITHRT